MKKQILLFSLLLASVFVHAQIGINASYLNKYSNSWTRDFTIITTNDTRSLGLPGTGWELGLDYRLKMKNIRIEFYPSLGFSRQKQDFQLNGLSLSTQTRGLHLGLNGRIYPLDLEGDCDCPTWRKEGPTLEKGLFVQLSTGFSFYGFEMTFPDDNILVDNDAQIFFGGGLGFDIGINDRLTITPQAMIHYYPQLNWDALESELLWKEREPEVDATSDLLQYQFGIHLGFHLGN